MADYLLSLDQGTTSSRAIIFDRSGTPVAKAQTEFAQIFPSPGLVEHDAKEIWATQLTVAQEVLSIAGLKATEVSAIGITNQRETTVIWDRATGEPVGNAIVWQDRRTADFCQKLAEEGHGGRIQEITGLIVDAYFSGSKIRWMLDHLTGVRERAERGELAFGTIDSWLVWNLTGGRLHLTDASNASRTMLCDITSTTWSEEMLELLQIPRSLLPEIRDSSEVYGECDAALFGAAIPIAGIAGDQQASLFGQACYSPGMAKNTYGTGCFALIHTGDAPIVSQHRLLSTVAWRIGGKTEYALEGSVFIAGAAVQWLRDQLGIIRSSEEIETLAAEVADNGGVYFVPAFAGLGAPYWDGFAKGTITGLTRGSNKAHLARAALEGIAYQTNDIIRAMMDDSGIILTELRVDGGASKNPLLMQIQADVLGVPVVRSRTSESTALGAAYLAGLAVGIWNDREELAQLWQEDSRFVPGPDQERMQGQLSAWEEAVRRTRS
ncbi:MAG: glycerol kinase GlpK [Verrucomicrobiales bacterium]|jgi:glycerol kinase|nr:glycerol kinase GlpK [Verrucomicrobiales bacterium]MBP9223578.1 glycerol kinase GlpK [Verrucomicrobiales bacterium]